MAAPATPKAPALGKSVYQLAIDVITLISNTSMPISYEQTQTGVISGTTASTIVASLIVQRDLL